MLFPETSDVLIRNLRETDLPKLALYANNEKVSINLRDGFPYPYTLANAQQFFEMVQKQNPTTLFAIEYQGEYVGNIGLTVGSDVYRKSAELGYFIGEPFWGKGIATKAVNLITTFGFEHLEIVRIHAGVFEFNIASQRVLEKCGFSKEGVFEKAVYKKETMYNEVRYALIKHKLK